LTAPDLLDLSARTTGPIVLQDRSWCKECPVGGCSEPWRASLESAESILDRVDPHRAAMLGVEKTPLPIEEAEPVVAALRPDKQANRRVFLRQLAGMTRAHDAKESKRVVFGRGVVRPIQRQRVLAAARSLADDLGVPLPASLMPEIRISDGCDLNGICAAICPTEALQKLVLDDGGVAIAFDAESCIDCGECQRACPSKALSLWPGGGEVLHEAPVVLVARQSKTCNGCGATFVPGKGSAEDLCSICNRTINVMRDMSDFLSGRQLAS
jgi:ferredoxin